MGVALMSRPKANGPEVTEPQGRADPSLVTKTTTTRISRRRRKPPQAYASIFAPDGRRKQWLITFICPHCKFGHRALAVTEDQARQLRPRGACGRLVRIRVARAYRGSPGATL